MLVDEIPVITVDGPSGSGKGTVCSMLASKLGWHYLDSGIVYRVLAYLYIKQFKNINIVEEKLINLATDLDPRLFILGNQSIAMTEFIRTEKCANVASLIATYPKVRDLLLFKQRKFLQPPGLVADGRDMGTVVFPEAKLKIFLQADLEVRAERRYLQLKRLGINVKLVDLIGELSKRDLRDTRRSVASLQVPKDATIIDTTAMAIDEVFANIMKRVILII